MKKVYSLSKILALAICICAVSLQQSSAQCVLQGTISEPGCTSGTNVVTQTNVGGKQEWNLNSTNGGDYTVSISAGNNGCGAYSISPSSFTASGSTTVVDIQAGGTCCWAAGGTSAVLTYTKIIYTNTTSNASLCQGSTRALTVSPAPVTPGAWSVFSGTGSISGNTFTPASAGPVTIRYTKGGCTSDVSFTVNPLSTAAAGATSAATVCATTNTYTIPPGYTSSNGTISWTSSGDGSFTSGGATTTPTYTFGTNDKATGGLITLTMHVSNGLCADATTTFGLTIVPQPTATPGATTTGSACASDNFFTLPAGYSSAHGTILWSATTTSGSLGILNNAATLTPTYTFSAADKAGSTITLTMTVSGAPCASASTTFTLTVNPVPTATQGATHTATVCANTGPFTVPSGYASTNGTVSWTAFSSSGTTGTITNGSSLTPTYNFSPADISSGGTVTLTMSVSSGACAAATTTFTLNIVGAPVATQGAISTGTACTTNNFYTLPAGYSSSNGNISWAATTTSGTIGSILNGNTLTPTYNFSAADMASGATIVLTMSVFNLTCPTPASTTFTLTITPPPTATQGATNTATACASANAFTVPSGYSSTGGTITWSAISTSGTNGTFSNNGTLTPTYNFSASDIATGGTVTLTMTVDDGGVCAPASTNFTLTITPLPVANAGATTSATACANSNFYTVPAGYSATNGSITWTAASTSGTTGFVSNPATPTPTYNFSAADIANGATVTLTMTVDDGGICTPSTTTFTLTIDQLPTATAGSTTSAATCAGNNAYTVPAGYAAGNGNITWTASSTSGATGSVTNPTTTTPTYNFSPSDISSGATVTLTMTVDDGGICPVATATFTLTIYQDPTTATVGSTQNLCGASISGPLGGNTPTVGSGTWTQAAGPGVTFFSSVNSGSSTASVTAPGQYIFAWTISTGGGTCTSVAYDTVNFSSSPTTATVGPDQNICGSLTSNPLGGNNPSVGIGTWTQLAGPGTSTFSYPDSGISTATVTALGLYTFQWTISNGTCVTSSASINVNFIPSPTGGTIPNASYCSSTGTGTVTVVGVANANQYAWALPAGLSGSSTGPTITVGGTVAGTYTVTVTPQNATSGVTCSGTPVTGTVQILALPVVDSVRGTTVTCFGGADTLVIYATSSNGTLQYSINGGGTYASTNQFAGIGAGNYNIYVKDDSSCSVAYGANPVVVTAPRTALSATSIATPVGCTGDSNGTINLLASGGAGGYVYHWSSGQNIQIISGLPAGIYVGSVTDGNGCVATVRDTLLAPAPIVASIAHTNVTCYGSGNGSATLTVSGGVAPYAILWSNFDTTLVVRRTGSGTLRVRITDSYGCEYSDSVKIKRPPLLTGILSVTNVACFGSNIDSIVADVTGGNAGGYTYAWTPSVSTTNSVVDVAPGQYVVTVTDTKGCTFIDSATITQPLTALTISSVVNNITCNNANNGSIEILSSGGVGGYTYSWATGQTTSVISGLSAGPYAVTVTDANGCTAALSFNLTNPSAIASTIVGTNAICSGAANGSATLTVSGGTPGYTYLWSDFDTAQNISGLSAGLYRVIIKDANGCQHYDSVIISDPAPMTATVAVRNIYCVGNTGSVVVTVSGGNPGPGGYNYTWSPIASSTDSVSGVGAGTYHVTATDANGCSVTAQGTVTQVPSTLSASALVTDMDCHNANDGSITILASGGAGAYTYAWDSSQTTSTISGLRAGPYTVTVSDAHGCTVTLTDTIHNPAAITSSVTGVNVTCAGASNGSATLTVSGGTPGYTYLWSDFDTSRNLTNVTGNLYRVIITDAKGCRHYDSVVIAEPQALAISIRVRNVSCFGAANGSVVATVTGGTPAVGGYSYSWAPVASSRDSVSGVGPGTYAVTASDANGCSITASGTVTQPNSPLSVLSNVVNVSCGGTSNGSISLSVNGGTPGYTYHWNNGQQTQNITGLAAGIDTVTVTDANGCQAIVIDTVKAPVPITSSIVGTNVTCAGADNGTATLTVNGGSTPYTFLWSDFSGAQNRDSLSAGWYYVIITDGYGCQKRDSVKILTPLPLVLSDTIIPVSCTNGDNGSIHIITSGGTGTPGTFTYTWTPSGPNSADNTNLSAGTYSVTVADSNHCTASLTVTLANPAPLTSTYTVTEPKCFGDRNGSITVIVGGGTPQYTYAWTPAGPNAASYTNIQAGTYNMTVTDSRGCTLRDTIVVNQPAPMYISGIQKNVSCHGNSDGFLMPTGYGGTQPYSYQWYLGTDTFAPQGPITENITQLPGGDYYLVITDANGCMAPFTRHILEPDSLIVTLSDSNATCFGSTTGSVLASVRGGTVPYQYLWNNFTTDSFQRNITAGTYSVVVTDSNGCHQNKSITITQSPELIVTLSSSSEPTCASSANGSATVTVTGGRPTYTYSWNTTPVQNTATASNLAAGTYIVTVTDLNGCSQTQTIVLTAPAPLEVNTAISNPTCAGGDNGFVSLDVRGGTAPYLYSWSTTPAQTGNVASALSAGTYYVTITDAHSCILLDSAVVVSPLPITVSIGVNSSTCPGNSVGVVVVTATGGLAPYNYALGSITQASDTFRNLGVGDYSVVVTDINGCQGSAPLVVGAVGTFTDTLTATPNVILAGETVHLLANAASDAAITSYVWSAYPSDSFDYSGCSNAGDCNSPTVRPTVTTDFVVVVTNARGCTLVDTVHVSVSNQPSIFVPLAFTPNGDGLNDHFEFDILGATTVNVQIWNRWGELVYSNPSQANGIDNTSGWDGNFRGQLAPYDTYTYQFDVTYFDGHHETKSGTVTIMR